MKIFASRQTRGELYASNGIVIFSAASSGLHCGMLKLLG
jgi:hypothetical protein